MDKENTLYIDLKDGRVTIELRPDLAPTHVAQIKKLAREGKYDGVVFHRVIDGFMAQTGDPTAPAWAAWASVCRPSSARSRTAAAPSRWRAPTIPTAPAASSSSA
jgi:cyclophilin family peptidyl-prolyl cis-trans isomerase